MSKSGRNEGKKRSRAITLIVRMIGRDLWNGLPTSEKSKRIKVVIVKTKIETKKGRNFMLNLNREYRGLIAA